MPNYVTHRMILTSENSVLAAIRERHFGPIKNYKGEATDFQWDFDSIIPMPQELKDVPRDGVSRYDAYLGELATGKPYPEAAYFHGQRGRKKELYSLDEMKMDFAKVHSPTATATSYAHLLALLAGAPPYRVSHQPRIEMSYLEVAERIGRAINACGYGDTLEWCTDQWGTKWGSFRAGFDCVGDGTLEFHFETAWSPPAPVFRKFAKMYPHVQFVGFAFDEGWNFEAEIVAFNGFCATEKRKATKEVYEYVYRKPYVEEPDEGSAA